MTLHAGTFAAERPFGLNLVVLHLHSSLSMTITRLYIANIGPSVVYAHMQYFFGA